MDRELRRLTADDYHDIIRVWADAGLPYRPQGRDHRDRIAIEIAREDTAFFGLFENDRMLAVGLATFDGRKGWINRVAVDPDRRGEGFGGEIIKALEQFLRARGADIIAALIEDVNSPSNSLFQ
ncbi:MAG: GNAT family N-acetyltransferase, partial [candidate division Zixibacteria bacterium]|nr:GNAT family N-acetyltransferase [candidate division Zixibacteria bacterium]